MRGAYCGDPRIVKDLIAAGADVNASDRYGKTAFDYGVESQNVEVLKALIEAKGNVNERLLGDNNATLLMIAADRGQSDFVKYLLDKGAVINARIITMRLHCTMRHLVILRP